MQDSRYKEIPATRNRLCGAVEEVFSSTVAGGTLSLESCILNLLTTTALFAATAVAEIVGCYLPWLWMKDRAPAWVLLPAAASLVAFVWLLSLHPTAAGRVYAAYGGVYVGVAVLWLWLVDGERPHLWDIVGVSVALAGMAIILFAPRG